MRGHRPDRFHVVVNGEGYLLLAEDGEINVGFYATRKIEALDANEASVLARKAIEDDLLKRKVKATSRAVLRVVDVYESPFWSFFKKPSGFTFYEL